MRITLCGSTRFKSQFDHWNHQLAIHGHTVYSLSLFGKQVSDQGKDGHPTISDEEKVTLDLIHLDKIINSDAIAVMNEGGYIGDSTRREIEWARIQGKTVYWLEGGLYGKPIDRLVSDLLS